MVDAVGTIAKVIEAALKIKKAADTVKQNEGLCKQIISRVDVLSNSLSQHQNNRELMNNLAVRVALEALDGTLGEALKLVMDCQEETNIVCLFYNSGNLSQRLKEVEQHISSKNMDTMFAIMGFLLPKQFNQHGAGAHPQPQQVYPASTQAPFQSQTMQPPNLPKQMSRQHNQDRGDVNVQTDDEPYPYAEIFHHARAERSDYGEHNIPAFGDWDYSMTKKPVVSTDDVVSEWDSSMVALCSCCAMAKKSKPARQRPGLPLRSLLQEIAAVALEVNEAAETVLQTE
ncbi:hypothetical protein SORBI_3008G173601 [Sorghum bicolor]|uniref:Mixed lineage kinase domain-containing protein n=1 Tax=Sorghum bicolor TaxID=4558 RepID=A0A1Z5R860_SORBI|nr:hypothetical protein SORBI_3008G173601 [Sorghum bicolor]